MPRFLRQPLPDVIVVEPDVHGDARGFFLETYHRDKYAEGGIPDVFVQDNHSLSRGGTLRGLHAQVRQPQAKLVRCVEGRVFDVAVDMRPDSPTFGKHVTVSLDAESHRQVFVPRGFAHGFCVLSEQAQVEYKCTALYAPGDEITVAWDDPDLAIAWPVTDPVLSEKDRRGVSLAEARERLRRAAG